MPKGNCFSLETMYGIGEEVWCWYNQRNTITGAISNLRVCRTKVNMIVVHVREDRNDIFFDLVTDDGHHIEKELNGMFDTEIEAYTDAVEWLAKEHVKRDGLK